MIWEFTLNFNHMKSSGGVCVLGFNPWLFCTLLPLRPPQVERFGKPTWKSLVEAVKDDTGCNNPALAQAIANDHLGMSPH